jgi:hypothetical protein
MVAGHPAGKLSEESGASDVLRAFGPNG